MSGIIYVIEDVVTHKRYVGQTINPRNRLKEHLRTLRRGNHHCPRLQMHVNKYGVDRLMFYQIDSADTTEELNFLETFWIDYYDSADNGFNHNLGGGNGMWSESVKEKMSKSRKRVWMNGDYHAKQVEAQRQATTYRWQTAAFREKIVAQSNKRRSSFPSLISPRGVVHTDIVGQREFCRTHNLNRGCMKKLIDGQYSQHKGWRLYDEKVSVSVVLYL